MIEIKIADISLRESEQVYSARMSFKEKLECAKLLEKLRTDVIETGYVGEAPADAVFIRTLAGTLEYSVLSVPVTLEKESADRAWSAMNKAKKPRLNVIVPASTVSMEYTYQMKAETVQKLAGEIASYCVSLCPDVEFTADDAVRADTLFLYSLLREAVRAGVKTITLCDSAGELLPEELADYLTVVRNAVPELNDVTLSLHCKDNLGLGSAAALTAVNAGAVQIKVSSSGVSGTLPLEQFLNVIKIRGETLGIATGVNTTALQRTCSQIAALTGSGSSGSLPSASKSDAGQERTEIMSDADINVLRNHINTLGYDVSEDDLVKIYNQFQEIAKNKKIDSRDIEALIAETAGQATAIYRLHNYVINSGSSITATAVVEIMKEGAPVRALSAGDGPIDAAFLAVEQAIGLGHFELEEFRIQAVTEGREAMGDALVKIRSESGKLYSGRGVSTDIVGASIRAYISAVNKIVYEERSQ